MTNSEEKIISEEQRILKKREQAFTKLKNNIEIIAQQWFIDFNIDRRTYREITHIAGKEIPYWKLLMGSFSYLNNRNTLLCGKPGTGKTTYTSILGSIFSGLPFDLFDALKIQCHPDQTKDTMFARADLGRLAEEGVVWQASIYLPSLTLDEMNRNSPGKQAIAMEYIRTGMVEHLSKVFYRGKIPVFATMNENGAGTYPIPPPSLDRFDISLPFDIPVAMWEEYLQDASERIEKQLANREMSSEIIHVLLDKDKSLEKKKDYLAAKSVENSQTLEKHGIKMLTTLEIEALLAAPKFSPDATHFYRSMIEEFNTSNAYGHLTELETPSEKDKAWAAGKAKNGLSPRALSAIKYYSGMLAGYMGSECTEIEHVMAVAPYCLAHRVQYFMDYESSSAVSRLLGERKDFDLSRRIVKEVKSNYDIVANDVKLLTLFLETDLEAFKEQRGIAAVKKLLTKPIPEYPYLRHLYVMSREKLGLTAAGPVVQNLNP